MTFLRKLGLVGAWALVALLVAGPTYSAEEPIVWLTDARAATAAAADSGRPLFIDVWAIWCEPCKLMEATTYRDPRIVRAMAGFVPLKVDADADEIFVERYEIDGFPTTMFLDAQGREISRLVSLVQTEDLLQAMTRVQEGYAAYLSQVDRRGDVASMRGAAGYLLCVGNEDGAADLLRGALKASREDDGAVVETIELELAGALLAGGRTGPGLKTLRRLSTDATVESVRGAALVALVRAERDQGRETRATEALSRLREEFPELVSQVE